MTLYLFQLCALHRLIALHFAKRFVAILPCVHRIRWNHLNDIDQHAVRIGCNEVALTKVWCWSTSLDKSSRL